MISIPEDPTAVRLNVRSLTLTWTPSMLLNFLTCNEHGWRSHISIHEAGHAVAAIVLYFEFVEVFINPCGDIIEEMSKGLLTEAGGVTMVAKTKDWVSSRPEDALVFLLCGAVAEKLFFGHALDQSSLGDLQVYRHGLGLTEETTREWVQQKLEMALPRAWKLIRENEDKVRRIFDLLVEAIYSSKTETFNERVSVSYGLVKSALNQNLQISRQSGSAATLNP